VLNGQVPEQQGAPPAAPVIHPGSVFSIDSATAALGLAPSCLKREVRLGRLRASRRGGRYFILGQWLLDWLAAGTATKRKRRKTAAGEN
jgi:hypothetical protein